MTIVAVAAIALTAAACGGTSSSDKTATTVAGGGVGGAAVTPVTSPAAHATPRATGTAATAAAGSPSAAASPARTGTAAAGGATTLQITTPSDTIFDKPTLTVPAGAHVTVTYTNNSDIAHNVHFFAGPSAASPSLGMTEIATGPTSQTMSFTAPPAPGTYLYQCDVHPTQMYGQLIVQ
jgi:plastocyanin